MEKVMESHEISKAQKSMYPDLVYCTFKSVLFEVCGMGPWDQMKWGLLLMLDLSCHFDVSYIFCQCSD